YREVCAPLPAAPQPRRDSPECALAEKPASRDRTEHAVRTGRVPRYNHTKDLAAALPTHVAGCFSRLSFDQQYCQRTVNSFTIKGIVRHLGPNRNHRPVAVVLCLAMLATGVRSATASRQGTNGAHPAQVSRSFRTGSASPRFDRCFLTLNRTAVDPRLGTPASGCAGVRPVLCCSSLIASAASSPI